MCQRHKRLISQLDGGRSHKNNDKARAYKTLGDVGIHDNSVLVDFYDMHCGMGGVHTQTDHAELCSTWFKLKSDTLASHVDVCGFVSLFAMTICG